MQSLSLKYGLFLCAMASLILNSCEEQAIHLPLSDTPLHLDTLSFGINQIVSYQSPPQMGGSDFLYLGTNDGFNHPYSLIQISEKDRTGSIDMKEFSDSLITVDSLVLFMHYEGDTSVSKSIFHLRYFPDGGDSVFSEQKSHYLNFDRSIASDVISTSVLEVDTTDTTLTKLWLRFVIPSGVLDFFSDTTINNHNRTFLVEPYGEVLDLYRFISRENIVEQFPELKIYYRQADSSSVDTLIRNFQTSKDISITIPAALTDRDTVLAVSKGKGLTMLVYADMGTLELPDKSIVKSANLILHSLNEDSSGKYILISYPLSVPGEFSNFKSYVEDPFDLNDNYFVATSLEENHFNVQLREFIYDLDMERVTNFGFKLYSSVTNDPFETIYFHGLDSDSLYPVIRIQYVLP